MKEDLQAIPLNNGLARAYFRDYSVAMVTVEEVYGTFALVANLFLGAIQGTGIDH